jgi:hypothetical protein
MARGAIVGPMGILIWPGDPEWPLPLFEAGADGNGSVNAEPKKGEIQGNGQDAPMRRKSRRENEKRTT